MRETPVSAVELEKWLDTQGGRVFTCRDACGCPVATYLRECLGWGSAHVNKYFALRDGYKRHENPEWLTAVVDAVDSSPTIDAQAAAACVRKATRGNENA
jgi:hypothetical protein